MNVVELSNKIHADLIAQHEIQIPKYVVEKTVRSVFENIAATVATGESVKVVNFGEFKAKTTKEHTGFDPDKMTTRIIPERRSCVFRQAAAVRDLMNEGK